MIYTGFDGSIGLPPTRGPRPAIPRAGGSITGVVGTIRWEYYTAAGIHGYTVSCTKDGVWSLTATVVLHDAFKMSQAPLVFCALRTKHGVDGHTVVKSAWRWPIRSCSLVDHQLTATLGPPEEEP